MTEENPQDNPSHPSLVKLVLLIVLIGAIVGVLIVFLANPGVVNQTIKQGIDDLVVSGRDAVDVAPHKAIYDVRLLSVRGDNQLADVRGSVYFEWTDSCENWSTSHNFKVKYDYEGMPAAQVVTDFDMLEAKSGETLYFTINRERNGKPHQEIRGAAEIGLTDRNGIVRYTLPEEMDKVLPSNTYFAVDHSLELIRRMKAGEVIFNAYLFEGSDLDDPTEVNAIIGKSVTPPEALLQIEEIDATLLESPARKVRLAFFATEEEDRDNTLPLYEMSAVLHENGVVSNMIVEYPGFSVEQTLTALEGLEPAECSL